VDELVVVDNGSSIIEAARLRGFAETDRRVVLVNGQGNVGFAKGANLGARRATGDVLVFLNPDAFLQPGCVSELVSAIEGRPVPCIVGGRVLNEDGSEQRGARRGDITLMSALLSLSHLARKIPAWRRYEVHWEQELPPEGVTSIPTISGACFCMRREDFEAVQGFDESYFLHVEDVDLCWRVRQAGGVVLFQPKAEVIHLGHTSRASPIRVEFHKGWAWPASSASAPAPVVRPWRPGCSRPDRLYGGYTAADVAGSGTDSLTGVRGSPGSP